LGLGTYPYTEEMSCAICAVRRPKRHCPGVGDEICSVCCGTGREETVTCPLECEYLRDARRHEKTIDGDGSKLPDTDIRVTDEFLREHEDLLIALGGIVSETALETPGAVDSDVRDALASLVRTYRTLVAGVYYETVPENAVAARVFRGVQDQIKRFRDKEQRNLGMPVTRDGDLLRCLVFLEQVAFSNNNGRRRGRAFIDLVRSLGTAAGNPRAAPQSLLVLP
jgi:hypothetical protein